MDSDERLLDDHAAGDEQAFSRLVERHHAGLTRFVARHLGSRRGWADDVTQDVFVKVYRAARQFEGRSSVRTWLFGIAFNVCRDYVRRERRDHAGDEVLAAIPGGSLDPLQRLERIERAALVRAAAGRLTPSQRLMLRLREREDMSYEEIAALLGVPLGTVRSRLHNARAALARALMEKLGQRGRGE